VNNTDCKGVFFTGQGDPKKVWLSKNYVFHAEIHVAWAGQVEAAECKQQPVRALAPPKPGQGHAFGERIPGEQMTNQLG